MIEAIDLKTFKLQSNFVLCKQDANFDILAIDGPEGKKIELKLISFGEHEANHYSISGTVIAVPDNIFYFSQADRLSHNYSQQEQASRVMASTQMDCNYPIVPGDKIFYNYNVQLSAEAEHRIVETEEYGLCLLISYDMLFGYLKDGDIQPLNGNVFFKREVRPEEYVTDSGLTVVQAVKVYDTNLGTVVSSDAPVRAYLDGGSDDNTEYVAGDRILIDKRFGYRMAYDLHGGEFTGVEVVNRKHVLLKFIEESEVKKEVIHGIPGFTTYFDKSTGFTYNMMNYDI